jgi:hypothetical protein
MMIFNKLPQLVSRNQLRLLSVGVVIIIAIWIIFLQHGWVTSDAILYFEMARLLADGQWDKAIAMFKWPFYPSLIALVHMVTGLSMQTSAQCLSVTFFATSLWALLNIVIQLGGGQRAQVLATLMILGSSYIVGDIMPMTTRDQGYWAFMLLALWQFIVFFKQGNFRNALAWQVLVLLATLFRIEGAVYILAFPLVILALPKPTIGGVNAIHLLFRAYAFFILLGILAALAMAMSSSANVDALGRLNELLTGFSDIEQNIKQNLMHRVDVMRDQVIGEPFKEFAWFTFLLSLFSISVIKCFFVAGWAPAILTLFSTQQSRDTLNKETLKVLGVFAGISWVIATLIILKVNILSGRYVILFGFVLIAVASIIADAQLQQWKRINLSNKVVLITCAIIILLGFIGNVLPKRDDFYYEIDAVQYVKQHANIKQQAVLYTSEKQRFYAGMPYEDRSYDEWQYLVDRIEDGRENQYEFVLINLNNKADSVEKEAYLKTHLTQFKQDKVFYGYKNKKRTLVYRRIR